MADETDNMVLRTLYLPRELDQTLKSAAIRGARSKGDVIRELISAGLEAKRKDPDSYLTEPARHRRPVEPTAVPRARTRKGSRVSASASKKARA